MIKSERNQFVGFHLSKEDRHELFRQAGLQNKSVSEWLAQLVREKLYGSTGSVV